MLARKNTKGQHCKVSFDFSFVYVMVLLLYSSSITTLQGRRASEEKSYIAVASSPGN